MKKVLLGVILILGLVLLGSLSGLHFKEINAIPGDVKMIQSLKMVIMQKQCYLKIKLIRHLEWRE